MKRSLLATLVLAFLTSAASALSIPGGAYRCVVDFGDILLAGSYPFEADGQPGGVMELQTSPEGVVTGDVFFLGDREEAVGSIRVRDGGVRLVLRGKVDESRISVKATLQGNAFVGTAAIRGKKFTCRLPVPGIAPIRVAFTLALTSPTDGQIAGNGVLRTGQMRLPVKVTGRIANGRVSLTLKAGKTTLKLNHGTFTSQGFVAAKWMAQGFGALRKGDNLQVRFDR